MRDYVVYRPCAAMKYRGGRKRNGVSSESGIE